MILGVQIVNFDVFKNDRIGLLMEDSIDVGTGKLSKAESIRLRNLNALIGRNNTGKTSFLMTMSFIRECIITNVAAASTSDGRPGFANLIIDKTKNAEFKILFRVKEDQTDRRIRSRFVQYELSIGTNDHGSPVVVRERVLKSHREDNKINIHELLSMDMGEGFVLDSNGNKCPTTIDDYHMTALGVYGKISNYKTVSNIYKEMEKWFFCRFSANVTDNYYMLGNAPGGHKHLDVTGSNVNNVLQYMQQTNPSEYERTIDNIISKIPSMKRKKTLPKQLDSSPDKLFLYLLLLKDQEPNSTIFIETPDRDLYHDMIDVLSDEMREFTLKNFIRDIKDNYDYVLIDCPPSFSSYSPLLSFSYSYFFILILIFFLVFFSVLH